MTDPRFAATVRSEGDSMVVDLIGDINAFATEDLESATAAALALHQLRVLSEAD